MTLASQTEPEWNWLGIFVANFGAAFFFVSYFTGQFVRIKRQTAVEQTLQSLTAQNTASIRETPVSRYSSHPIAKIDVQVSPMLPNFAARPR